MTSITETDRRVQIAQDYRKLFAGTLDEEFVNKTAEAIEAAPLAAAAVYPANGAIASMIFWLRCRCNIDNGKSFVGDAFGIAVPGGSALFGDVYTDDLNKLYSATEKFTLIAAIAYTTFIFHDGNGTVLGSFQAGALGTTTGTAYGSGSWS
jgi:hypothetical protein